MAIKTGPSEDFMSKFKNSNKGKSSKKDNKNMKSSSKSKLMKHMSKDCD